MTPFGDGRLIIGALGMNSVRPFATANYTLIDPSSSTRLFPEFWIQTSRTPAAGEYTAAPNNWYDQVAAFAPDGSGFCDSAAIMDWTGGTAGATVSVANLQASTQGGKSQAAWAANQFGWRLFGAATGMTYSTSAYQPFARQLDCSFYSGNGSGTFGLAYSTSQTAHSAAYYWEPSSPTVSAAVCFSTDLPDTDSGGPNDVFAIFADAGGPRDYNNVVLQGNSSHLRIYMESGTTSTVESVPVSSGHQYWLYLQYVKDGAHTLQVYDGCGASPTLLGTITSPAISGGSLANYLIVGSGGALTTTKGKNFFYGAVKLDYLYGGLLVP
jgi:hypothetical protein